MEQVLTLNITKLKAENCTFAEVVRPIQHLMHFFYCQPESYCFLLRGFQPDIFPRVLISFARMFEVINDELTSRFYQASSEGLTLALSEGVAAIDRLGHYCLTGSRRILDRNLLTYLDTLPSLENCGWPYINPSRLDLRPSSGQMSVGSWPFSQDNKPRLLHISSLRFHYGDVIATRRLQSVLFKELSIGHIRNYSTALAFLKNLLQETWVPQMAMFVHFQAIRLSKERAKLTDLTTYEGDFVADVCKKAND